MWLYRCSVIGCRSQGCYHCTVTLKDGTSLNLFYCDSDDHFLEVGFGFRNKAANAENIEEVKRIKGFRLQSNRKTTTTIEKPLKRVADSSWEWVENADYWMNVQGQTVKIATLEDREIEDAVVAIRKANIKKVTKRISWIKEIEEVCSSAALYAYPESALHVGDIEDAYAKLEEFYEVMTERNMLP